MAKCHSCNKLLNKKSTVLECVRCQKVVHATSICSGLSAKQLGALKAAENLEWTCNDCNQNSFRRKSFVTLDEHDNEEDDEISAPGTAFDVKQLLQDLKKEVKNIVTQEIRAVSASLQYCSEKVDEFTESMDALTSKVKDMEKKIAHLDNQNRSSLLKIEFLEQRNVELEQQQLGDHVEIAGIPDSNDVDLPKLVESLVVKLGAPKDDVVSVRRLPSRRTGSGPVQVRVRQESTRQQLMSSARESTIIAKDLMPNLTGSPATEKIYIRKALTTYNKSLLWQAKQEMKGIYKYIWIRDGKIHLLLTMGRLLIRCVMTY
ncbi:Uncharacterized protein OBRU01_25320 [Operophtera brumata]|uniref:Zinc finger DNA binding protein n=1 Tax=Operophtera brumata TaxID=104452 RepID=A0A0L7K886_OPEBR|nr:Uncharacterized protein OBRU01_25320 [Operophtera brumata]